MAAKKSTSPQASEGVVKVKALVPIEHDQIPYDIDEEFDLPAESVKALEDIGAIKVLSAAAKQE